MELAVKKTDRLPLILNETQANYMEVAKHADKDGYKVIVSDEVVFENGCYRITKKAEWPGSTVYTDKGTGLLRVLLPGSEVFNINCKATFALPDGYRATNLIFNYMSSFHEGLSLVGVPGRGYGFIDKNMKFEIPLQFNIAHEFVNGFAKATLGRDGDYRWLFIDKSGKKLVFSGKHVDQYKNICDISDGMFRVSMVGEVIFANQGDFRLAYHHDD